jgi:hypothetical protein
MLRLGGSPNPGGPLLQRLDNPVIKASDDKLSHGAHLKNAIII